MQKIQPELPTTTSKWGITELQEILPLFSCNVSSINIRVMASLLLWRQGCNMAVWGMCRQSVRAFFQLPIICSRLFHIHVNNSVNKCAPDTLPITCIQSLVTLLSKRQTLLISTQLNVDMLHLHADIGFLKVLDENTDYLSENIAFVQFLES